MLVTAGKFFNILDSETRLECQLQLGNFFNILDSDIMNLVPGLTEKLANWAAARVHNLPTEAQSWVKSVQRKTSHKVRHILEVQDFQTKLMESMTSGFYG